MTIAVKLGTRRALQEQWQLPDDHALLLHAALDEGESALRAWRLLRDRFDVETISGDVYRLAPLLGWNLQQAGLSPDEDPILPRLLGLTRRTWLQVQRNLQGVALTVDALRANGIDTAVMKGAALAVSAYPALGLRPMEDVDLLVRSRHRDAAFDVLGSIGFEVPQRPVARSEHGYTAVSPTGVKVDVHWQLNPLLTRVASHPAMARLWQRRVELALPDGSVVSTLDPADQMLVVLAHGISSPKTAPLRWIADATWLTRSSSIDWPYFIDQVRDLGATFSARRALQILQAMRTAVVPDWVLDDLYRQRTSVTDRLLLMSLRDRRVPSAARSLVLSLRADDPDARLRLFPLRLAEVLGADSTGDLPGTLARRGSSYMRRIQSR